MLLELDPGPGEATGLGSNVTSQCEPLSSPQGQYTCLNAVEDVDTRGVELIQLTYKGSYIALYIVFTLCSPPFFGTYFWRIFNLFPIKLNGGNCFKPLPLSTLLTLRWKSQSTFKKNSQDLLIQICPFDSF